MYAMKFAGTVALAAVLAGCAGGGGGPDANPREVAPTHASPMTTPSSAVLATLPDGPDKRKFILDCAGCHQLDVARMYVDVPGGDDRTGRTAEQWRPILERMLRYGGVRGESPLIAPDRDAAATAAWLAEHVRGEPSPRRALDIPQGAVITPYLFPFPADLPHDVAVDDRGRVVVTGMFTHQMLRLDPERRAGDADGRWDTIPIPVGAANPRAIEIDDRGRWWVLLGQPGKIARYDPAADEWDDWDIGMYGHSLRLDAEGDVWFNGHFTRHPSIIGVLDGESGRVRTFEIPDRPDPQADHPMPYGLRVGPDGRVWGTELRGNRLFAFSPETRDTEVWLLPVPHSGPRRPAIDDAGRIWIPEFANNRLTRFDPATAEFEAWDLPVPDALPYVAEYDRGRGLVWVGTAAADAVFSFDPASGEFTAYPMPTADALIRHLVVDEERGDVWAAYGAFPGIEPRIVRIRPAG